MVMSRCRYVLREKSTECSGLRTVSWGSLRDTLGKQLGRTIRFRDSCNDRQIFQVFEWLLGNHAAGQRASDWRLILSRAVVPLLANAAQWGWFVV
jgi:hypothetical protein